MARTYTYVVGRRRLECAARAGMVSAIEWLDGASERARPAGQLPL